MNCTWGHPFSEIDEQILMIHGIKVDSYSSHPFNLHIGSAISFHFTVVLYVSNLDPRLIRM